MSMPPSGRLGAALLSLVFLWTAPAGGVTPNGKLQIIHLDVGQGDGAVLITPEGQVAMIDDGGAVFPSFPCARILAQLDTLGITHIDYHFASHYHADHIGCFSAIDNVVHFDQGWDRAGSYGSGAYTSYAAQLGARRHTLARGQVFTLDSLAAHPVTITCIDFNSTGTDDYENSKSVVLRVNYGSYSEVFGGDLTGYSGTGRYDRETAFGPEVGNVMVYKVHHHSSKYSSSDAWLNATAPMAGIISLGDGNPYSFTTTEALSRLHSHQIKTYWTEAGAGATPNPLWDKVAEGRITITAAWEGQGKTVISGGYGAAAFSDTLTNPSMPTGACCIPGTPCAVIAWDECTPEGGVWRGVGTNCSPDLCATSTASPRDLRVGEGFLAAVPNPFSLTTALRFRLEQERSVRLEVLDAGGRRIWALDAGRLPPGVHSLDWDGRAIGGNPASPGVYFARLAAGTRSWTRTLIRIR